MGVVSSSVLAISSCNFVDEDGKISVYVYSPQYLSILELVSAVISAEV